MFREGVRMPEAELAALRAQPAWPARVAAAPTIVRELRAIPQVALDPAQAARIAAPALLLTGSDSRDPFAAGVGTVAAALPDARVGGLEGQQHVADILDPGRFAATWSGSCGGADGRGPVRRPLGRRDAAGRLGRGGRAAAGAGPGSLCDHTAFDPLVAELRGAMTTFAMDRRGFGASGDAAGYALEQEFEDVAAVVEAVAARVGEAGGSAATPTGPAAPWAAPP